MRITSSNFTGKLAVLTAAIALSSAAFAAGGQSPAASATDAQAAPAATAQHGDKARHHRGHRAGNHHQMRDAAMWVPGYGPLGKEVVQSLNLTAEQTALLDSAKADQQADRKARRAAIKSSHAERLAQLQAGKIEPQAALKKAEEARAQALASKQQHDAKWLAVWDSLDKTQQTKVATHLSERADKFAKRIEQKKQLRQDRLKQKSASEQVAS